MTVGFAIKLPSHKSSNNNSQHKTSNILEKDVEGYVKEVINSSGIANYYVVADDTIVYTIHPDSYESRGKRYLYVKDELGRWIQWDRPVKEDRRRASKCYMPFRPKYRVKGNLIRNEDNTISFKIKLCWNEHNLEQYDKLVNEENNNESDGD